MKDQINQILLIFIDGNELLKKRYGVTVGEIEQSSNGWHIELKSQGHTHPDLDWASIRDQLEQQIASLTDTAVFIQLLDAKKRVVN